MVAVGKGLGLRNKESNTCQPHHFTTGHRLPSAKGKPKGSIQISVPHKWMGAQQLAGGIGRALGGMYIAERDKADDIAAQDAIARAQNKQTDLLYNPKTGVMFRKGADLYENARQFADDFQTEMDGIRNSLGNDRVKERFQRVRESLWNEFNRSLSIHVNRRLLTLQKRRQKIFWRPQKPGP